METVDVSFSISSCSGERQELAKRQVPRREREKFNSNEKREARRVREEYERNHRERREREVGKERRSEVEGKSSSRGRHGGRSASPLGSNRRSRSKHRSRSPPPQSERDRNEGKNSWGAERSDDDNYDDSVSKMKAAEEALEAKQKKQSSFELSGKLAAETNRVRGITFLFIKPPYAKKPDIRWRLYVFKGGEALNEPLYIHRQSCYLFWRERRVVDIPTDHPSRSKKHAVIQFRQVEKERPDGMLKNQVRPYMMDLGSTNKTFINDNPIEPQRYYELFEKDAIKFGSSCREYVQLHENSA
eukprot:XP_024467403.1 FHA domain-containing protein DDL [Populus trichocarpa]